MARKDSNDGGARSSKRTAPTSGSSPQKSAPKEKRSSGSDADPKRGKKASNQPKFNLLSLSQLAEHCDIDRSVARKRLQAAKIKPVVSEEKKKLYELTPEVEELLSQSGDPKYDEAKTREAIANAQLKELKVERERGRLIDFDEACDELLEVFKALHDRFVVKYAAAAGTRLHKLRTGREVSAALKRDFTKIFGELRADYRRFLK